MHDTGIKKAIWNGNDYEAAMNVHIEPLYANRLYRTMVTTLLTSHFTVSINIALQLNILSHNEASTLLKSRLSMRRK